MLSCFVCMVNELPPRFLFYKNEGTAEDTGKKFSLARFQSVNKIQMKHSMKDRGMQVVRGTTTVQTNQKAGFRSRGTNGPISVQQKVM